jgi:hypothetical protein
VVRRAASRSGNRAKKGERSEKPRCSPELRLV